MELSRAEGGTRERGTPLDLDRTGRPEAGGTPGGPVSGRGVWSLAALGVLAVLVAGASGEADSLRARRKLDRGAGRERLVVGNPGEVTTPVAGGAVLIGGGSDRVSEAAFRLLIQQSGGGDLVVLREDKDPGYNQFIFDLGGLDSVETLGVGSREEAEDPQVVVTVANAEAIFIAGGDQGAYVSAWDDTALEAAVDAAIARGVPIGGTSAGLAVLGAFDFTALNGTVYSSEALADPYNRYMTLGRTFLQAPHLAATITDSHFVARDRMGRLVAFLARIVQDGWAPEARGIGVDERTALLVASDGTVTRVGEGAAYMLRTPGPPELCAPGQPLRFHNVGVYRLTGAATFDLVTWQGSGGLAYTVSAADGRLTSTAPGGSLY
mgnify:CR=1 FL=1